MLGFLFGFNTRLGRVPFVVCTVVLVAGFLMLVTAATGTAPSRSNTDILLAQGSNNVFLICVAIFSMVANFMLQSMRVRDIGWDPVTVMLGWVVIVVIDYIVAGKHPEWALTYQHTGTIIGVFATGALTLALMGWPTERAEGHDDEPSFVPNPSEGTWCKSNTPVAPSRIARVASGEFGGRTR